VRLAAADARLPSGSAGNEGQPDDCPSETMNSAGIDSMLLRWKGRNHETQQLEIQSLEI
jgi:hypothetical protein